MATTGDGYRTAVLPTDRRLRRSSPPPRPAHAVWKPPLSPIRRTVREVGVNLITAGAVVLLFVAYQLWGSGFAEAASQHKLARQFVAATATPSTAGDASAVGGAVAPVAGPPQGAAIAHMVIPKLGLDKYVVEGIGDDALREGPGHYPGTPMPGEAGNVAIAGHRTTFGAPFYDLNRLVAGDGIVLTTKAGQFHYTVFAAMIVKPSDVAVIAPTSDNRLTLTTCNPRFQATSRLIVVARLDTPTVTPPSTIAPPVVIRSLNLGSGDRSAWPPTISYGLIVAGLWALVRIYAAQVTSRRWLPFLVGIPVCLVPLWFLFENVIRLLPNNI